MTNTVKGSICIFSHWLLPGHCGEWLAWCVQTGAKMLGACGGDQKSPFHRLCGWYGFPKNRL